MKQPLRMTDFLDYRLPSRLTPSPSGGHIAFIVTKCDYENNCYCSDVFILDRKSHEVRKLTERGDIKSLAWIDDETLLMGVGKYNYPAQNGKTFTCYHSIKLDGAEEREEFVIPAKVSGIKRVDEKRYVILAEYYVDCPDDEALAERQERLSSYLVYDEMPFRRNGRGYTNKVRLRLYVYDAGNGAMIPVSDETEEIECYSVSDRRIIYSGKHFGFQKRKTFLNGLAVYDIDGKTKTRLIDDETFRVRYCGALNEQIVFAATDGKRYGYAEENPYFFYISEVGSWSVFAENEYSASNSVGSDARFGINGGMCVRDNGIYYLSTRGGDAHLFHASLDGELKQVSFEPGTVDEFVVFDDEIIMIAMRGNHIDELYSLKNGKEEKLTSFNDWVAEERTVSTPEYVTFENDGVALEGYAMKPVGWEKGKKYPGILTIHGGYKCAYGNVFNHELQYWANQGFFVIFCNPRGSDGRDNEFSDIVGKFGDVDYSDIMRFTDVCLERYPELDGSRLGVTGGSYGGFMTNWIIGHTDRFKCAVSKCSIGSRFYQFGAGDTGYQKMMYDTSGDNTFWENEAAFWDQSPLKYAHNCVTPTLFIASEKDYRCPIGNAEMMFSVLQYNGVESRMCVFKGDNHKLSTGKPVNRVNRLKECMDWMDKHLKD